MDGLHPEAVELFQEQMRDLLEKQHSGPIMSVVGVLPKEELAEMAEALVNLTSLKRRVTSEDETVGGPVAVAVISKGDGLIWIKRKHYFAPELNHRFLTEIRVCHQENRGQGVNRRLDEELRQAIVEKNRPPHRTVYTPGEDPEEFGRRAARDLFEVHKERSRHQRPVGEALNAGSMPVSVFGRPGDG